MAKIAPVGEAAAVKPPALNLEEEEKKADVLSKKAHKHVKPPMTPREKRLYARRAFRVALLWGFALFFVFGMAPLSVWLLRVHEHEEAPATRPLEIYVADCDVVFQDANRKESKVQLVLRAQTDSTLKVSAGANATRVEATNAGDDCTLRVKIPRGARLPSLAVFSWPGDAPTQACAEEALNQGFLTCFANTPGECAGKLDATPCDQVRYDQRPLRPVTNKKMKAGLMVDRLELEGSMVSVDLKGLAATTASVQVVKGTVLLRNANVTNHLVVKSMEGDVAATFVGPAVRVNYTTAYTDYCLAAENVTGVVERAYNATTDVTFGDDNATMAVLTRSSGSALLCATGSACSNRGGPSAELLAPHGAAYASLLPESLSVDALFKDAKAALPGRHVGVSMTQPHFDAEGVYYLGETEDWINEAANFDHLQVVEMQGPGQDFGKFVHTTSAAYVYVRPWVLSSMSAGLLTPRSRVIYARSTPAQCPFHDGIASHDAHDFASELGPIDTIIRYLANVETPAATFLNARSTSEGTSTTYDRGGSDEYAGTDVSIEDFVVGRFAIAFALTLACAAALVAAIAALAANDELNQYLDRQINRRLRFVHLRSMIESGTLFAPEAIGQGEDDGDVGQVEANAARRHVCDLVEDLMDAHARGADSCLRVFVERVTRPRAAKDPVGRGPTLAEFRESFELWAILSRKKLESVAGARASKLFEDVASHRIEQVCESTTDAYTRVRFRTPTELARAKALGETMRPQPGEHSLAAFMRMRCVATGLDGDYILRSDMATRYYNFCVALDLNTPMIMTKGVMQDEFGVHYKRLTIPTLAPLDGKFVIDLTLAENGRLKVPEPKPSWLLFDATVVFIDFVVLIAPPAVFAGLAAYSQDLQQPVSNKGHCYMTRFWLGPEYACFGTMSPWNRTIVHLSVGCWFGCLIYATLHHLTVDPDRRTEVALGREPPAPPGALGPLKNVMDRGAKCVVFGSAGALVGYVVLTLVWSVLGMILNPDAFLAYGVAALALVTVAGLRKDLVIEMATAAEEKACSSIKKSLQLIATSNAAQIPANQTRRSEASHDVVVRAISRQALTCGLGEHVSAESVIRLLRGDDGGIAAIAEETGFHPGIVEFALAKATFDEQRVRSLALRLADEDGVAISPKMVSCLADLCRDADETAVKRLFNVWSEAGPGTGTVDSNLVASSVFAASNPAAFVATFDLDRSPSFKLLLAKLTADEHLMYVAAAAVVDECLGEKLSAGKLGNAFKAWAQLKQGKYVLGTWKRDEAHYEHLADLVFGEHIARLPADVRAMLPRFIFARVSSRKTLMMTMAQHLASLVKTEVLPAGGDGLVTDTLESTLLAMIACKYGSDVNVRSFARECNVNEATANSIAFMLSSQRSSSTAGGAAFFQVLTHLDLSNSMSFLGESSSQSGGSGNSDRVLGVMAIAQHHPHSDEMTDFVRALVHDFAVLHLGGEEPKICKLATKVHVIVDLLVVLCTRCPDAIRGAARSLRGMDGQRVLSDELVDVLLYGFGQFTGTTIDLADKLASELCVFLRAR